MIKVVSATTEYYCTTEDEAHQVVHGHKQRTLGEVTRQQIDIKEDYVKLVVKEEINSFAELAKQDARDNNDYVELFEEEI
ncbi:hypothetical protein [Hutsoniella sourekii]|uniref:hypothetical protein n=1 Tax=Hutsoniella sourekii TaxID=87650 RepID=UPI000489022F|nr:hypothetical protein [Hutsoniella sourekii]